MKLSVWQQFSSNHSASFTIVAVFENPEQANKAKEQLEEIFKRITAWYNEDQTRWAYIYDLSPIEQDLATQYQIQWDSVLAWFHNAVFAIEDNVLAISSEEQADSGAYPIDILLAKFGAKVAVDGDRIRYEDFRFGLLEIICIAPNTEIAETIIKTYKGNYESKEDKIFLKLKALHFDFPTSLSKKPEWFKVFAYLKAQGCEDIQIKVSDTRLDDMDDYDRLSLQWK